MFNFFLSPLYKVLAFFSVVGLGILAILNYGRVKKKEGKTGFISDQLKKDLVKRSEAREDAFKEKRDIDGISDSDLVDRLRRRSDRWGGM